MKNNGIVLLLVLACCQTAWRNPPTPDRISSCSSSMILAMAIPDRLVAPISPRRISIGSPKRVWYSLKRTSRTRRAVLAAAACSWECMGSASANTAWRAVCRFRKTSLHWPNSCATTDTLPARLGNGMLAPSFKGPPPADSWRLPSTRHGSQTEILLMQDRGWRGGLAHGNRRG